MKKVILKNFKIVDEASSFFGSIVVENGIISELIHGDSSPDEKNCFGIIDGNNLPGTPVLMPAFVDLHAHFRDSFSDTAELPAETIESGCLAAVAGGFGTVVCMANTKPVIDTIEKASRVRDRAGALGLIDLYPVLSLTKNMDGKELSDISDDNSYHPPMFSEDGKDLANDDLFLAAMKRAGTMGTVVSCHCDFGGQEAEAAKAAGKSRAEWSRIEENNAVRRAVELGRLAGCHTHIAHVSTKESAAFIREVKRSVALSSGFTLTCEATPHHIGAVEEDANRLGGETFGRVNPPLRTNIDREAIIFALQDGTIDAIATDHAPHSETAKAAGTPGFVGLETAFAVCLANLITSDAAQDTGLQRLSALMSANPARILKLDTGAAGRGRIAPGLRADFVVVDTQAVWKVKPEQFKSRGKCSPFTGKELRGKILMTIHEGRIVFDGGGNV